MTETEWQDSSNHKDMLAWLEEHGWPRDKQLQFALAVFRTIQPHDRQLENVARHWEKTKASEPLELQEDWLQSYKEMNFASVLREIAGNPFRRWKPPPMIHLNPTVVAVARGCYEHRHENGTLDPDRLGVLADALEDAGEDDAWTLNHLRGLDGVKSHHRGCWVIDEILEESENF
jgi:hypothetical protein